MRIIAGKHKGRKIGLSKEAGQNVRPTSDFAREAIFNILAHGKHGLNGHTFDGQHVLDLFCGSGAFGLEALSRGAQSVTFVDQAREAMSSARANAEHIGEMDNAEFLMADATQLPRPRKKYSLVFLDPPYSKNLVTPALKSLQYGGWLAEGALLVAERDVKNELKLPEGFILVDERRYGRAVVALIKLQ